MATHGKATAKVPRVESATQGVLITSQSSPGDEEDYSGDEEEKTDVRIERACVTRIFLRIMVDDPPQSPLGEQTKPTFLDMFNDVDADEVQESIEIEDMRPKPIIVDDYKSAKDRGEPIAWACPDITLN